MKATKIPAKTETKTVEIEPEKYVLELSKEEAWILFKAIAAHNSGYHIYEQLKIMLAK